MKKLSLLAAALCASVSFNLRAEVVEIATPEDFAEKIAANPAGDYKLTANIDLTGSGYVTTPEFSGTLDGNGKTLSGVGAQALFGVLSGTVKSLTLDGLIGETHTAMSYGGAVTDYCLGALCLSNYCGRIEGAVVRGYKIYGTFTGNNSSRHYFGPFAARALGTAVVVDCVSTNNLIGGDRVGKAGGIVGGASFVGDVDGGPQILSCVNYSKVYGNTYSNGEDIGGIVGTFGGDAGKVAIVSNCVNYGDVCVDTNIKDVTLGGISGGLCGGKGAAASTTLMIDCANRGSVRYVQTSNGGSKCGGLLGQVAENVGGFTLLRCVNYGDVTLGANATGNAVGLVNYINAEYKGSGVVVQDCANYGNLIAPNGSACGLSGGLVWHPSYGCHVEFRNCANYGVLNGSDHTKDYQLVSSVANRNSSTTCDCSNYVKFLNSFATGATLNVDPMLNPYTIDGCFSSTDDDYDAKTCNAMLKTVAKAQGYESWVVGKVGGVEYPELGIFCTNPCGGGLMLLFR